MFTDMICLCHTQLLPNAKAAVESSFAVAKSLRGLLGDRLRVGFRWDFPWRYHLQLIGLREKITGKCHISQENLWFPVDFPLSQPIEHRQRD